MDSSFEQGNNDSKEFCKKWHYDPQFRHGYRLLDYPSQSEHESSYPIEETLENKSDFLQLKKKITLENFIKPDWAGGEILGQPKQKAQDNTNQNYLSPCSFPRAVTRLKKSIISCLQARFGKDHQITKHAKEMFKTILKGFVNATRFLTFCLYVKEISRLNFINLLIITWQSPKCENCNQICSKFIAALIQLQKVCDDNEDLMGIWKVANRGKKTTRLERQQKFEIATEEIKQDIEEQLFSFTNKIGWVLQLETNVTTFN